MKGSDRCGQKVAYVADMKNGGLGIRFSVRVAGEVIPAFAVRYDNVVRAFKNRCGHIAINLDMQPGNFFTEEGDFLVCSTHGALYQPDSGKCTGGPCFGVGLEALEVVERSGYLYLLGDEVELLDQAAQC